MREERVRIYSTSKVHNNFLEFYEGSPKILVKNFESRPHIYHEILRITNPTQVKFYTFNCI